MYINKMGKQLIICNYIENFISEHEYIWENESVKKSFSRDMERSLTFGRTSSVLKLKLFLLPILKS